MMFSLNKNRLESNILKILLFDIYRRSLENYLLHAVLFGFRFLDVL